MKSAVLRTEAVQNECQLPMYYALTYKDHIFFGYTKVYQRLSVCLFKYLS